MIDHRTFRRLSLSEFVDPDRIEHVDDWEYLDRRWTCDRVGFTEWCQSKSGHGLRAISIDLSELDPGTVAAMLGRLMLPISAGMSIDRLVGVLGPFDGRRQFVEDRSTFLWRLRSPSYDVEVTVRDAHGAIHVTAVIN